MYQPFTDGKTNKLVGVWYLGHYTDMVLIRIYGNNSDLLIDRKNELNNIRVKILYINFIHYILFFHILDIINSNLKFYILMFTEDIANFIYICSE